MIHTQFFSKSYLFKVFYMSFFYFDLLVFSLHRLRRLRHGRFYLPRRFYTQLNQYFNHWFGLFFHRGSGTMRGFIVTVRVARHSKFRRYRFRRYAFIRRIFSRKTTEFGGFRHSLRSRRWRFAGQTSYSETPAFDLLHFVIQRSQQPYPGQKHVSQARNGSLRNTDFGNVFKGLLDYIPGKFLKFKFSVPNLKSLGFGNTLFNRFVLEPEKSRLWHTRLIRLIDANLLTYVSVRDALVKFYRFQFLNFFDDFRVHRLNKMFKLLIYSNISHAFFNNKPSRFVNKIWVSKSVRFGLDLIRRQFFYFSHKTFKYQQRITRYILAFYRLKAYELFFYAEFQLFNILVRSCFFNSTPFLLGYVRSGFVFLNNSQVFNLNKALFILDTISITINPQYYMLYRWHFMATRLKVRRFLFFAFYWQSRNFRKYPKDRSYRIPRWVVSYRFYFNFIPVYMEIDFFLLTLIMLLSYTYFMRFYFSFFTKTTPFSVIRSHNWKFLT